MLSESKRILVTGGSGFIGSNVVKALVERNHQVIVFDDGFRDSTNKFSDRVRGVKYIGGDVRSENELFLAIRKENVDVLCHMASINGTKYFYQIPQVVLDVGIRGCLNTIQLCLTNGIKEYILISSSEVCQEPNEIPIDENCHVSIPDMFNPRYSYAGCKIISELLVINNSRFFDRTLIIRPFNVYGPGMGNEHVIPELIQRISNLDGDELEIQGDGSETRAFCYIDDFVEGFLLVLDKGENRNIYNIGNDTETSIINMVGRLSSILDRNFSIKNSPRKEGGISRRCPNIEKIRKLGYFPRIDLYEGLKRTANWYTKRNGQ